MTTAPMAHARLVAEPARATPVAITEDDARYALAIVERICREVGPGTPGTREERARAAVLRDELERHLGPRNVTVEEFAFARGFLEAVPLSSVSLAVAALLNVSIGRLPVSPAVTALGAVTFSLAAIALVAFEFFLGFEIVDRFLPKKSSVNVIGALRRPGTADVRRVLVLSGHHDSAPENTWLGLLGYGAFVTSAISVLGVATMLVMSAMQWIGVVTGGAALTRAGTLGWMLVAFPILPSIVFGLSFIRRSRGGGTVPGAADNLAASALAVAMCRFLVMHPSFIPANTEIRFVSFGGEEAGVRGSRRYVERHLAELKELDARVLNFETVAHPKVGILTSDISGSVKHSPRMVSRVVVAAQRARVPYEVRPATLGVGTDAAPFSRAGIEATALLPFDLPRQLVEFYHQRSDRPEVLSVEALLNVLKITLEWIRGEGEG